MKKTLLAVALIFAALPSHAQTPPPSLDLFQIGSSFGLNHSYRVGVDKSATAGACAQREVHDGQWLAGPCRDVFILAHKKSDGSEISVAHVGGAVMYNAEHGNATYSLRLGFSVGPVAHAALIKASEDVPGLEGIGGLKIPKWAAYVGDITTVDFAVGYRPTHDASVNGNWGYGPMVKVDIPLDDLYSLVKFGL